MKTKLAMIVVAMLAAAWMASGTSPTVRSMEQRMTELEQVVAQQMQALMAQAQKIDELQAQIAMQQTQLAAHQQEIDRFSPLADFMHIEPASPGLSWLVVSGGINARGTLFSNKSVTTAGYVQTLGNIYYKGELIKIN